MLFRSLAKTCAAFALTVMLVSVSAHAQGEVPLIPVATEQSALNLSNQFGVPAAAAINQAGDFAFVGNGDTALFLRVAGASAPTRLLQIDDELPNFPGSQIQFIWPELGINSSRTLFFGARFTGADGLTHSALMTYVGTTYRTVVTSDSFVPNSTSTTYGVNLEPGSIDDSGDVNFAAVPTGTNSPVYYIAPAGFATVFRIAGTADTPPCILHVVHGFGQFFRKFFYGNPRKQYCTSRSFTSFHSEIECSGPDALRSLGGPIRWRKRWQLHADTDGGHGTV
jgi:hypothetical protein